MDNLILKNCADCVNCWPVHWTEHREMGQSNNPTCRKCGTEEETSDHVLCEALASLRYTYLGSFFLDPEEIRKLGMRAIWNFAKGTGLL